MSGLFILAVYKALRTIEAASAANLPFVSKSLAFISWSSKLGVLTTLSAASCAN